LRARARLNWLGPGQRIMTNFLGWSGVMGNDEKMIIVYIKDV
jgi:hypothetical protein